MYTKAIKTELTDQNQPPTAITEGIDHGDWKKKKKERKKQDTDDNVQFGCQLNALNLFKF